jgi:hypothetical protein
VVVAANTQNGTHRIKFSYFAWQKEVRRSIVEDYANLIVMACAARTGKDRVSAMLIFEIAYRLCFERITQEASGERVPLVPRVNIWVVAPKKALYNQPWNELIAVIPKKLIETNNRARGIIILRGDIHISFKSADDPELLVSEGVDILWFTEASRVASPVAWNESLQPRLASPGRLGLAMINGSPRNGIGHWFRDLWEDAKKREEEARRQGKKSKIRQWNLPTSANPLMVESKIIDLHNGMRIERLRNSELYGLWPSDDEKPFKAADVIDLFVDHGIQLQGPFVTSIDIARKKDWTFLTRWMPAVKQKNGEMTKPQVVATLKFRNVRFNDQINRCVEFYRQGPGKIIMDSTNNGGQYFHDEITRRLKGVEVIGQDFHKRVDWDRNGLYEGLIGAVEDHGFEIRRDLIGEEDYAEVKKQLDEFQVEITEDDEWKYYGDPDDAVTSLAMGWYLIQTCPAIEDNFDYDDFLMGLFGNVEDLSLEDYVRMTA